MGSVPQRPQCGEKSHFGAILFSFLRAFHILKEVHNLYLKKLTKGNKSEGMDDFSLCEVKGYRSEVFLKEVGSKSFVSVGLMPTSAAPKLCLLIFSL